MHGTAKETDIVIRWADTGLEDYGADDFIERLDVLGYSLGGIVAQALPHGRLHVVPGAGHLFLFDEADSVVSELESFLAG